MIRTIIWLLGWQGLVSLIKIPEFILPSPLAVTKAIFTYKSLLIYHAGWSSLEALLGLISAILLGVLSGLFFFLYPKIQRNVSPVFLLLQSIPGFVIMPLFLVWFGYGLTPRLLTITLSCYFPILSCLRDGLNKTPKHLLEHVRLLQGSPNHVLLRVRLPYALPDFFSGLKLASIYAPIAVLSVDWVGAQGGLGYLVMLSHSRLEMDLLFASLAVIACLVFMLKFCVEAVEKRLVFWKGF